MLHVCRDFLSIGNPITLSVVYLAQYLQACFLRGVLGYTVVGQTNFNLDGSVLTKGSGVAGSLNQGPADVYAFAPNGYTVSAADINRILAIKSPANGMVNSGLFRVMSVDVTNNWLYINYRSGDVPPAETGMTWRLFADEVVFNGIMNFVGNGIAGTYTGQGAATQSRIILQSPSTLNWQVRIALENSTDVAGGVSPPASGNGSTTTPGYGGNSAGDFAPGGQHTHMMLFLNKSDNSYHGCTVGFWPAVSNQIRMYAWGDDVTGTAFIAARSVVPGSSTSDSFVHFGLAEDEEQPLPPKNAQRLFVMGANAFYGNGVNGIYWACGSTMARGGMSFGLSNQPISCIYSLYNPLAGQLFSGNTSLRGSSVANDCPYIGATELLPVDLLAGTNDNQNNQGTGGPEVMVLEGRRLGRAPFVRLGRANFGYFQTSTDANRTWLHLNDGMYLPWRGSILP